jgi:peroxiredoxin
VSQRISAETLDAPVAGVNLAPGSLRDQIGERQTLFVFLRFFGCVFCRETVTDLRQISEKDPDYPQVLFISESGSTEARAFLRRYWPTAATISDSDKSLYSAFGVGKGSVWKMFGPGVFSSGLRAKTKGHQSGHVDGDIWRMPGVFLVAGDKILWQHEFRHAADHPDFARIPELAAQSTAES